MAYKKEIRHSWRFIVIVILLSMGLFGLIWRMISLAVFDRSFLKNQGDQRVLRTITIPAYRGMITDRNGEPLAISTPVDSVWINPQTFQPSHDVLKQIAKILQIPTHTISHKLTPHDEREFVFLRRAVEPTVAGQINDLNIPGVYLTREYRRYYPEGEVTSHILGFTDIDDKGQEGLEFAYNNWLSGTLGKIRVIKDRLGRTVSAVKTLTEAHPGNNLSLSLDRRIQYLAYRELKSAMNSFSAKSGSVVVLNVKTGEVLAMVNQPSFNPNDRSRYNNAHLRNRAVTDVFEPGSVIKPFSIVSALDSGRYQPDTLIDTSPGWMMVSGNTVKDEHDYGVASVTKILKRSSNVGVTKMTLSLPPEQLWGLLRRLGFGERTGSGFPGEVSGSLVKQQILRPFVLATLAFGYGISVTPLQLANAYAAIANHGIKLPVTFLKVDKPVQGERVIDNNVASEMLSMLEAVVEEGGTGKEAQIPGYHVAGKTGTARMLGPKGYDKNRHVASFVGIAPVNDPALVVAVTIKDPQKAGYYGSQVAAPVFAKIMGGSLRMMGVAPQLSTTKVEKNDNA